MPMFRRVAMARRFSALSVQLATKTAMSGSFSAISGCSRNTACAVCASFFEQTARMMPRRFSASA